MTAHSEVHPEPEEGCKECRDTPRPFPMRGRTIEEVLATARINIPEPTERDVRASLERLRRDYAEETAALERLRRSLEEWGNEGETDGP